MNARLIKWIVLGLLVAGIAVAVIYGVFDNAVSGFR